MKKAFAIIALFVSLSLAVTGCTGGSANAASWLGQSLSVEDIQSIALTNLNGEPVRELEAAEWEEIVNGINKAKVDESPYIMMLTGYTMTIKLSDGEIRFTSYGSETNVVAAITMGEKTQSVHLVCPEIAKILIKDLDQDTLTAEEPEA